MYSTRGSCLGITHHIFCQGFDFSMYWRKLHTSLFPDTSADSIQKIQWRERISTTNQMGKKHALREIFIKYSVCIIWLPFKKVYLYLLVFIRMKEKYFEVIFNSILLDFVLKQSTFIDCLQIWFLLEILFTSTLTSAFIVSKAQSF